MDRHEHAVLEPARKLRSSAEAQRNNGSGVIGLLNGWELAAPPKVPALGVASKNLAEIHTHMHACMHTRIPHTCTDAAQMDGYGRDMKTHTNA